VPPGIRLDAASRPTSPIRPARAEPRRAGAVVSIGPLSSRGDRALRFRPRLGSSTAQSGLRSLADRLDAALWADTVPLRWDELGGCRSDERSKFRIRAGIRGAVAPVTRVAVTCSDRVRENVRWAYLCKIPRFNGGNRLRIVGRLQCFF
jgi:hypothetical protein